MVFLAGGFIPQIEEKGIKVVEASRKVPEKGTEILFRAREAQSHVESA